MTNEGGRAVRMAYIVATVGGVASFVMSVALLAIWPGQLLEDQTRAMSPESPLGLSASELRGREVYGREGCAYCHTQQIRYVPADIARFGAPTLAWETRFDYPHLWGTRRIGPDLARAGATRSEDWQFAHLYSPRSVVSDSVMPAYRSLFDGSAERPRQAARDLVAYLESLGRAREIAGVEGEANARAACDCPDDALAQMAFDAPGLNASPARTRRGGDWPTLPPSPDLERGRQLYRVNCSSCHGDEGRGDGQGAAALRPRPANLAEHDYTMARLSDALWNGVAGTAMQAWRDHPVEDLAALAGVVRGFSSTATDTALTPTLIELGERVYAENCVQCHGVDGGGAGTAADEIRVAPTDFRRQRPSLTESLRALRTGIDGTPMAPWTDRLSEAELLSVAQYVRSFFETDTPGGGLLP